MPPVLEEAPPVPEEATLDDVDADVPPAPPEESDVAPTSHPKAKSRHDVKNTVQ
jgi:hypothetical protein